MKYVRIFEYSFVHMIHTFVYFEGVSLLKLWASRTWEYQ